MHHHPSFLIMTKRTIKMMTHLKNSIHNKIESSNEKSKNGHVATELNSEQKSSVLLQKKKEALLANSIERSNIFFQVSSTG